MQLIGWYSLLMLFQNTLWLSAIVGMIMHFSWQGLLVGIMLGWTFWLIGVSGGLHKMSAHRAFTPKNRFCKILLLAFATLCGFGNTLVWAAIHRVHHPNSDTEKDPHSPKYGSFWRIFFLLLDLRKVYDHKLIQDIVNDKDHQWFARYYYGIHIALALTLTAISPWALIYCYLVPQLYLCLTMGWLTVGTHCHNLINKHVGYTNFDKFDHVYNSKIICCLLPGDGNHNNHHEYPGAAKNSVTDKDIDIGFWFIKLVGKNINVAGHSK